MQHTRTRERDDAQVRRLSRVGRLAIGLAVLGGIVALVNETLSYRRSGNVDWEPVALAFGVPLLIYVIVRSASRR
jgi:hypothetical protein